MSQSLEERSPIPTVKLVTRAFMRNPHPALRSLREAPRPVAPIVKNGLRMWLVTRYDDVRRVLVDRSFERDMSKRIRHSAHAVVRPKRAALLPRGLRRGVLDRDGEDHRRLRGLIQGHFRPDRVIQLQPRIQEVTDELLDVLPRDEAVDLMAGFARPLATTIIAEVVGVPPGARQGFPRWESSIFTGTTKDEIESAGRNIYEFCKRLLARKRAEPGPDVATTLAQAQRDGKLDEDEAASTLTNLLIGAMESFSAIGNGVALLLTHRDQLTKLLGDMRLLPGCVEEVLRYESPFVMLGPRFGSQDLELEGVTIPAGEVIALCPAAANRDPRQFSNPDAFDITRHPNPHLTYGPGEHHCIGMHLSRLEISVALESFFRRFPQSRLARPWEDLAWRPGAYLRRLDSLPVVLEADADA